MPTITRGLTAAISCARASLTAAIGLLLLAGPTLALDIVYRKGGGRTVGGDITKVTKSEVVVNQKVGNREEAVPANEISHIEWDAEPGPLKLARGSENTGNLDEAIRQYEEAVKAAPAGRDGLRREIEFGLARATARRALRSGGELEPAVTRLKNFINGNRDHYRVFDAQLLLGEALLASEDALTADVSFQIVSEAPWGDYQMAGKNGMARSALARGDAAAARALFDEVAAVNPADPAQKSRRLEALLGQAQCLSTEGQADESLKILGQVIDEAAEADSRIQATAYLRQGDILRAAGSNPKEAVLAYLHVDVIPDFSAEADLHAEALYHLAALWPAAGEAARGADAGARLQAQYPQSPWTAKLGSPPTN
ncbi:MAG: tetratricopeptide repeat protein [Planctomyces sp.]|nr:tetratricopeptide repeat protein [Planctomyces sp.]